MINQATAVKVTENQKKADVSTVVQPVKSFEVSEAKVIILKLCFFYDKYQYYKKYLKKS